MLTVTTKLTCNRCGKEMVKVIDDWVVDPGLVARVRKAAKEYGWLVALVHPGTYELVDYCPECRPPSRG